MFEGPHMPGAHHVRRVACHTQLGPGLLMKRDMAPPSGYIVNDFFTVECTLTVLKKLPNIYGSRLSCYRGAPAML